MKLKKKLTLVPETNLKIYTFNATPDDLDRFKILLYFSHKALGNEGLNKRGAQMALNGIFYGHKEFGLEFPKWVERGWVERCGLRWAK